MLRVEHMYTANEELGYIKKNDFKIFGWYRIILGFVVLFIIGVVL